MPEANRTWWIVLTPAIGGNLFGVLVTHEGAPVHMLMDVTEKPLVKALAARADLTVDVSVAHGWEQAPDGLHELYKAQRAPRRQP